MGTQESKLGHRVSILENCEVYDMKLTLRLANWVSGHNLGQMISNQIFNPILASQDDLPTGKNVLIKNVYSVHLVIIFFTLPW